MDPAINNSERRKSPRLLKDIPVEFRIIPQDDFPAPPFETYKETARDIGPDGVFIEINGLKEELLTKLCSGEYKMDLRMLLMDGEMDVSAVAEAVWIKGADALTGETRGLGLKFIDIKQEEKNRLVSFISETQKNKIRQEIERFLTVEVSDELLDGDKIELLERLEAEDLERLIPERGRAFFVKKAVVIKVDNSLKVLAIVPVTFQICEGHMPNFPILPLGIAGWVLSQGGEILISYLENGLSKKSLIKKLPLVCKTGPVEARHKGYIASGSILLVVGVLKRKCLGISEVDTEGWIIGGGKAIIMSRVLYTVLVDTRLWS